MMFVPIAACVLAAVAAAPGSGVLSLYYSGLSNASIKYNAGPGWISPCPGSACVPFVASSNSSYPSSAGWQYVEIGGNTISFVELNAGGSYDHCTGGSNCQVTAPGIYVQENGALTTIATFPTGCPSSCVAPHGTCQAPWDVCVCAQGYFGIDCSATCQAGGNGLPCSGHGNCSSSSAQCQCDDGWASCSPSGPGSACSTSVESDPNNCGGCNVVCAADPSKGIANATCANAQCSVSCEAGYVQCPGAPGICVNETAGCGLPGCETYSDNQCSGDNITTPTIYGNRTWQTPPPGDANYLLSYQQHYRLTGYTRLVYTDATRTVANASIVTFTRYPTETLEYSWDGGITWSANSWTTFCALGSSACATPTASVSANGTVRGSLGSALAAEPAFFIWAVPPLAPSPGRDDRGGQKGGIIELFGWPHKDVAAECADMGAAGWLGAKLWPVMESVASWEPYNGALNPWYFYYQPVSINRLDGRGGSMEDLRAAVTACRAAGVRLYADAVTNHMVGAGNDALQQHRAAGGGNSCNEWGPKTSSAELWFPRNSSRGPSFTATQDYQYYPDENTGQPPSQEFPSVPYSTLDFHCERPLNSWTDPLDLNAGWLEGLVDLNTETLYVQTRIADYMTNLVSFGFTGLRIDAAKHIAPEDHIAILTIFRANMGGALPPDFIEWMEVLTGGEGDMLVANNASGYNYGGWIESALIAAGFSEAEMLAIKLWADYYPKQPGEDNGNVDMRRKAIQNDDADQQTSGSTSRDMGNAGCVLTVNCPDAPTHRAFEVELFSNPPGSSDPDNDYPIRLLLSSYWFDIGASSYGIPDGFSDCAKCVTQCSQCTASMPYSPAHVENAPGYTPNSIGAYTRTHRDTAIIDAMRAWVHLPPMEQ